MKRFILLLVALALAFGSLPSTGAQVAYGQAATATPDPTLELFHATGVVATGVNTVGGYGPEKAIDGVQNGGEANSYAGSIGTMPYLTLHLPSAAILQRIRYNNNTQGQDAAAISVYGSNDGSSWTLLDTPTGACAYVSAIWDTTIINSTSYSYYRFGYSGAWCTSSQGYWRVSEIYGYSAPAPTSTPTNTYTNTPLPTNTSTNTPIPPTNTPIPPTNTYTNTPLPTNTPTNTPIPPTNTPIPPTNTPAPPTQTPTSCTGGDLFYAKSASAWNTDTGSSPSFFVDCDNGGTAPSQWTSNGAQAGAWIAVDAGSVVSVNYFTFLEGHGGLSCYCAYNVSIQHSLDGATWVTDLTNVQAQQTMNLPTSTSGRYWRMIAGNNDFGNYGRWWVNQWSAFGGFVNTPGPATGTPTYTPAPNATNTPGCSGCTPVPLPTNTPISVVFPTNTPGPVTNCTPGPVAGTAMQILSDRITNGCAYCWGSRDPTVQHSGQWCPSGYGLDCSGAGIWAFRQAGLNMADGTVDSLYRRYPHTGCTLQQNSTALACWQVGDFAVLCCEAGVPYHMAWYAGSGIWNDCYNTNVGCIRHDIRTWGDYQRDFAGAGRVVTDGAIGQCGGTGGGGSPPPTATPTSPAGQSLFDIGALFAGGIHAIGGTQNGSGGEVNETGAYMNNGNAPIAYPSGSMKFIQWQQTDFGCLPALPFVGWKFCFMYDELQQVNFGTLASLPLWPFSVALFALLIRILIKRM